MKIIGKNSLLYWLRIPFAVYTVGFIMSCVWIIGLIALYFISGNLNSFTSQSTWANSNTEIVQFKYPFTKMVMATENTSEGILLAAVGLLSFSFILFFAMKIFNQLSKEEIFTKSIIKDFKLLGFGMIAFGFVTMILDVTDGFNFNKKSFDLTPPFFYILVGFILIFLKEIFVKGQRIQEENDLTI